MRTTVELPDDLIMPAKAQVAMAGISLKDLFIEALESRLATGRCPDDGNSSSGTWKYRKMAGPQRPLPPCAEAMM